MNSLKETFATIRWPMLVFPFIFSYATYWIRAYRWKLILKPLGFDVSVANSYHAIMIGYLANLAVPRLGELSRCVSMKQMENVPITQGLGTMIVSRAADAVVMLALLGVTALIYGQKMTDFLVDRLWIPFTDGLAERFANNTTGITIVGIILIGLTIGFLVFLKRSKFGEKVKSKLSKFKDSLLTIFYSDDKVLISFLSVLIWICYFCSITFMTFAFPVADVLHWYDPLLPLMMTSIAMLAPVQGGIGAYHWMGTQAYIILGLTYTDGLAITTMVHLFAVLLMLFAGVYSLRKKGLSLMDLQAVKSKEA